ncbi:elongation factor 1-gamma 1 [Trichomonascus vanleenenianus]|uniref:elongation factor 1-gamma 1 n=1 Tax=Trichomonascus vanleenenianus TaxID=2268995 RepID=UPI003ECB504F
MSQGVLYTSERARGFLPKALVKYLNLDVSIAAPEGEAFEAQFPLKKIPAFKGADGFNLTESIAVNLYLCTLSKEKGAALLGSSEKEYLDIVHWMSFTNSELFRDMFIQISPILGREPYNKKNVDAAVAALEPRLTLLEKHLTKKTYLVGERVSVADLYLASMLYRGFSNIFGEEWRKQYPAITRHYSTLLSQDVLQGVIPLEFIAQPKKPAPAPKKEQPKKKEAQKPAAAAPKKEEPKKEAEEEAAPKKVAHPLAELGPAKKMPLDSWKRTYSNEETRETAIPWFWEHYDPEEYSLWKVAYKYNDELTLTFMSNNLIGGFFNRLSASTKYMFGTAVVYGENNNNGIIGAFVVRGKEWLPAFDVAPDFESYDITPLDISKPEEKDFFENMLAWDKPVVIEGKEREIADGKVFK